VSDGKCVEKPSFLNLMCSFFVNSFEFPDCFFSVFFWGNVGWQLGNPIPIYEIGRVREKEEIERAERAREKVGCFCGVGRKHVLVLPSLKHL
jgi:hypothetical protein